VTPEAVVLSRDSTFQLTATAEDSSGRIVAGAAIAWSSYDTTRVRVSGTGLVKAVAPSGSEIRAVAGGKTGYAEVVVVAQPASLRIMADSLVINPGHVLGLRAEVLDSGAVITRVGPTTWTSSDMTVATVDSLGTLRALHVGATVVSVEVTPLTATVTVTVRAPVASVVIEPDSASLVIGQSQQLAAVSRDSASNVLTDRPVAWSTCCGGSVSVSPGGLVTAQSGGVTRVVATVEGKADTAVLVSTLDAPVALMSAGYIHTCATSAAGTTYCWGDGSYGQLGTGVNIRGIVPTPVAVAGGLRFTSLASYGDGGCGLDAAGDASCWGRDDWGQLGNATGVAPCTYGTPCRGAPARAADPLLFRAVAPGGVHTCGVSMSGASYCWGLVNALGSGSSRASGTEAPVLVTGGYVFSSIAAGEYHTCALTADGSAFCWGLNNTGQLGNGATDTLWHTAPGSVAGGQAFTALAMGQYRGCGLTATGTVYCWGETYGAPPSLVASPVSLASIAGGHDFDCGLSASGAAFCWGGNAYGQLGNGSTAASATPVAVSGGLRFSALVAGGYHACGLATDGHMYCWGDNNDGEVGDGTYYVNSRSTPTLVTGQP
jgi:alpha-tubulin suppressor-like RCC1 family protein